MKSCRSQSRPLLGSSKLHKRLRKREHKRASSSLEDGDLPPSRCVPRNRRGKMASMDQIRQIDFADCQMDSWLYGNDFGGNGGDPFVEEVTTTTSLMPRTNSLIDYTDQTELDNNFGAKSRSMESLFRFVVQFGSLTPLFGHSRLVVHPKSMPLMLNSV